MSLTRRSSPNDINRGVSASSYNAFAVCDVRRQDCDDGSIILQNTVALPSPLPDVIDRFDHWAASSDTAVLITEPSDAGRRSLTYGDAARLSLALAALLIERGCKPGNVVCVVAGAGCDHAAVKLACLRAGLIHAPLSPSLTATESGLSKLQAMVQTCQPAIILAEDACLPALRKSEASSSVTVSSLTRLANDAAGVVGTHSTLPDDRTGTAPEDSAAIYFTSGSTGNAKGVLVTRRMIAAVQSAIAAHWPFLTHDRPQIADWLPWHHVFGGLDNFFKMVWNGGTYHVRPTPTPDTIAETAALITSTEPTIYVDVPFGIKLLLDQLESHPDFRTAFFARLELIFFAGAGMDAETWSRLNRVINQSSDVVRPTLRLASGYGSTEAGSTICLAHEQPGSPGEIGVPLPGHSLRLADVDGHMEIRVRGPNVSPGYIDAHGSIPMPLDELGFLKTGDVAAPVRPFHPELGLRFDGRVAEDFKLTNGTRVRVGALRQTLLTACAPYLADVAIAGETHDYLGVLLFPSHAATELDPVTCTRFFEKALADHNAQWPNSSMAVRRAIVIEGRPDPSAGEVNDKGHLVQRACLRNRQTDVERLYAKRPDRSVIVPAMPSNQV
jgi:feruloyl-CoA synthase